MRGVAAVGTCWRFALLRLLRPRGIGRLEHGYGLMFLCGGCYCHVGLWREQTPVVRRQRGVLCCMGSYQGQSVRYVAV